MFILFIVFALPLLALETKTETHWLEKTAVRIQLTQYGNDGHKALYVNLHENESTSIAAVREYLASRNGHFVALKQNGLRNISFVYRGTKFQFDPNRMFTKDGRIASLKLLNKRYVSKTEEIVEEFSDKIIARVKQAKIVVALHNNTNGRPLTVKNYQNRYVNPGMDTDDFVITTEKAIFERLKAKKINVAWETTATSVDDGSLAYFCSKKNIPYVNVEAQSGHKTQQLRMLNALTDIINGYIN